MKPSITFKNVSNATHAILISLILIKADVLGRFLPLIFAAVYFIPLVVKVAYSPAKSSFSPNATPTISLELFVGLFFMTELLSRFSNIASLGISVFGLTGGAFANFDPFLGTMNNQTVRSIAEAAIWVVRFIAVALVILVLLTSAQIIQL